MTRQKPTNTPASVRDQLHHMSKQIGQDFQLLLTRYAIERILYRLAQSPHADHFVLKGATLLLAWTGESKRPTRDLDLAGYGDLSEATLRQLFREVCVVRVPDDGLKFDEHNIRLEPIREDQEYHDHRVLVTGHLGVARIPVQIDVGIGDAVRPEPERISYPTLLDFPAPVVIAYPRETVIAEKFHAMVLLGIANSRMKDFFDIWILAQSFSIEGPRLAEAVRSTFDRRNTPLPNAPPVALTEQFSLDRMKQQQWKAFTSRLGLTTKDTLDSVVEVVRDLIWPVVEATREHRPFSSYWRSPGPWWLSSA